MSLKTCKILQTIAVILFALAFLFVLLSIPFKNTLLKLAYPDAMIAALDAEIFVVSVFPSINFIAALVYLGISLIHFAALKNPLKKYILASVIVCSVILFIYKVLSPVLNNYFTERAFARGEADGSAYYNAYAVLENTLYSFLTFLTVPGSILMFLSLGGSIGKGGTEATADENEANAAKAVQQEAAANTGVPAEQKPSAPKTLSLPGLEDTKPAEPIDPAAYHRAFQRPKAEE